MKLGIVFDGIIRMYKKHKWLSFLMIVQCFICTLLINMIFATTLKTHESVSKFNKFIGNKSYYYICNDGEDNGDFSRYLKNKNGEYEKLKEFVGCIRNEKRWGFFTMDTQSIDINSPNIPDEFLWQYECGHPIENESKSKKCVKCLHVSQNVFSEFGITPSEGSGFKPEDFLHNEGECVPIILGHEYKGILSIGQILNGSYLDEHFKFKVVGFLPSLTDIPSPGNTGNTLSCDRYVIMPAFSFATSDKEASFFDQASLAQYSDGVIISDMNYADVQKRVDELSLKTGTMKFMVNPEMSDLLKSLASVSSQELSRLIYIFIILTIFTIISMSITINGFIRENYYEYGVHLISGAAPKFLILQAIGFIALIVGISFLISSLVCMVLVSPLAPIISAIFSLLVLILSSIVPVTVIKKADVSSLIRRS